MLTLETTLETTLGEALDHLYNLVAQLKLMRVYSGSDYHWAILYRRKSRDLKLSELEGFSGVLGKFATGEDFLRDLRWNERRLSEEITRHPIIAKRAGLKIQAY